MPVTSTQSFILTTLAATGLLVLSAHLKVAIPGTPVPLTFQTLVVSLMAFTMGPVAALAALSLYLAGGLVGLPFFAPGVSVFAIGINAFLRPTFGYLIGFFPMVLASSYLANLFKKIVAGQTSSTQPSLLSSVALLSTAALLGSFLCFACGVIWLKLLMGDWQMAFTLGFLPFLLGDVVKSVLAGLIAAPLRRNS